MTTTSENHVVHPLAVCESSEVGEGTSVDAFARIRSDAVIGTNCSIGNGVFIENDVVVGDRVTVHSGVQILDGVHIGDDASIGPNSTILSGATIGRRAIVGAGAVVSHDVPANAKVMSSSARIVGYADTAPVESDVPGVAPVKDRRRSPLPAGVKVIDGPVHTDLRGSLAVCDFSKELPFEPSRCFTVFAVPSRHVRGEHAHRACWQYLTCVSGSLTVHLDDGTRRASFSLDRPGLGLVIPPMVWASQFNSTSDAVLVVLASHSYDPDDYIRDYGEFLSLIAG